MLDFDHGVRNEPDEAGIVADLRGGDPERTVTWRPGGRTVTGRLSSSLANVRSRDTRIPRAGGRCPRACRGGAAVTTRQPFVRHQTNGPQAGRRRKASPPPAALPYLPGERPPGTPRWRMAPFLRHGALAVSARGSDPPEPPDGLRPGSSVTGPGPCLPGGATPGTPRWLKAPFLRHGALAVFTRGNAPPGTSRWPVFTRGERPPEPRWPTARLARGALLSNPGWPKAPWCATGPSVVAGIRSRPGSRSPRARRRRRTWPSPGGCRWRSTGPRR